MKHWEDSSLCSVKMGGLYQHLTSDGASQKGKFKEQTAEAGQEGFWQ